MSSTIRVAILGNGGVGKTSFLNRYINNMFDENVESTDKVTRVVTNKYTFYDTPNFFLFDDKLLKKCKVAIIVVRKDKPNTFKCGKGIIDKIRLRYPNVLPIMCCVASDLEISFINEKQEEYYTRNCTYLEVSCKTGYNVNSIFTLLDMSL